MPVTLQKPRILILYAHPGHEQSRVNSRLREAASAVPHVRLHDLYETYPDFRIDLKHEQGLLEQSDLVVLQHPMQWYGMPSLLKEWIDVVFEHGWAYGHEGNALRGKGFWLVATTGGRADAYTESGYHGRPFSDFLPPYEQTARLCGMQWLEPFVVHGARQITEEDIAVQAARYRALLESYPIWEDGSRAAGGFRVE
jgi:putative NADPH-quinone reductase